MRLNYTSRAHKWAKSIHCLKTNYCSSIQNGQLKNKTIVNTAITTIILGKENET